MSWSTFGRTLLRVLFIIYCIEAGVLLVLAPWRDVWLRLILDLPWGQIRELLVTPFGRSLVSGFGLIHLVWGFHDLHHLLQRRRSAPAAAGVRQSS